MGFKEEIDAAWQEQQESQLIQEYRATFQNWKNVTTETLAKFNEIKKKNNFTTVDQSIKDEGSACYSGVEQAGIFAHNHRAFADWEQPK